MSFILSFKLQWKRVLRPCVFWDQAYMKQCLLINILYFEVNLFEYKIFHANLHANFHFKLLGIRTLMVPIIALLFFWMQFLSFYQVWRDITPTLYLLYFTPIISIYIRQKCLFFYILYISFGNPATAIRCILF